MDKHPALSGIRTHDPSNQPAKTHASDRTANVTGFFFNLITKFSQLYSLHSIKIKNECE
jgi:hypothetical protein